MPVIDRQYLYSGSAVFTVRMPNASVQEEGNTHTFKVQGEMLPRDLSLLPAGKSQPPYHVAYGVGRILHSNYNALYPYGVLLGLLTLSGEVRFLPGQADTVRGQLFQSAVTQILQGEKEPLLIHGEWMCCLCGRAMTIPGDPDEQAGSSWEKCRWRRRQKGMPVRCRGLCKSRKATVAPIVLDKNFDAV